MSRYLMRASLLALGVATTGSTAAQSERVDRQAQPLSSHFSSLAAEHWALDEAEQRRLAYLVNIEQAFTAVDRLTPYEILGKYAESDAERRHYAERYTEAMAAHQRRSLRWAVAVTERTREQEAMLRQSLLSDPLIGGYLGSIGAGEPVANAIPLRWHLHVTPDCPSCFAMTDTAMAALDSESITGLDVIFIGMHDADEAAVLAWVEEAGLTIETIRSGRVTVNTDSDAWQRERGGRDLPMLIDGDTGVPVSD